LIDTPRGPRRIEHLCKGDPIWTADKDAQTIRWIWDGTDPIENVDENSYPVLIQAGALALGLPTDDLIAAQNIKFLLAWSANWKITLRRRLLHQQDRLYHCLEFASCWV
jgi:hypothetical protein